MSNIISRTIKRLKGRSGNDVEPVSRIRCVSKDDYLAAFQMTLGEWLIHHQQNVVFKHCNWMGIRAVKSPLDAWIYQEILFEVQPDVLVEIGSLYGGTTLYFAHLMDLLGKGQVISVDIDRSRYEAKHDRIVDITGDSSSDEVVEQVARLCEGKRVLVLHDGDHTREQVTKDLAAYAPLVSVGSYLIIEDGIVDLFEPGDGLGWRRDGPLAAVEEFITANPNFVVDEQRERYIMTYNPRGYLKRVK